MTRLISFLLVLQVSAISGCSENSSGDRQRNSKPEVDSWITSPSEGILFTKQKVSLFSSELSNPDPVIVVDTSVVYQTIDGFGNCLTGGSAILLNSMSQERRSTLLKELFEWDSTNIGISYLRISIGASDLSDRVFSYNDMPPGQIDQGLENFSIAPEQTDLIPILKEILAINPVIKIMGSPWSAPAWMKTNGSSVGGSLKPEFYDSYARYLVKYLQAMEAEGIPVDAITIQNEPLHGGNNPSMLMQAAEQARFIRENLGPAFTSAGIATKIVVYDHNADRTDYPMAIYADDEASGYIDGAAFHLYAGSIDALSEVHEAYPGKNLYFTEQWVGGPGDLAGDLPWHIEKLIIGATRNWCRNVLEWNLASDPSYKPHTEGGCDRCLGTVTIDGNTVTRNTAYYVLTHAAKFVRPGSVRINTNLPGNLPNVAFKTPENEKVVIVLNSLAARKNFNLKFKNEYVQLSLAKGAVGTYIWR
jgi:glucosylceramidase